LIKTQNFLAFGSKRNPITKEHSQSGLIEQHHSSKRGTLVLNDENKSLLLERNVFSDFLSK
jgi:hypothetical protein